MPKPIVFLSHIHEEASIANALKLLIEDKFLRHVNVFVSSSPQSNRPGRDWQDEIKRNLRTCDLAIILAGPHSIGRRWINFEGGAVWARGRVVIPLCHSGIDEKSLELPLNMLTVLKAGVEDDLKLLFKEVADLLDGTVPQADFSEFLELVNNYESESQQIQEAKEASPVSAIRGLLPFEFVTLSIIAENSEGIGYTGLKTLAPAAGLVAVKAVLGVKMLLRKGFLTENWDEQAESYYFYLTDAGWKWFEANHDLIEDKPPSPEFPF